MHLEREPDPQQNVEQDHRSLPEERLDGLSVDIPVRLDSADVPRTEANTALPGFSTADEPQLGFRDTVVSKLIRVTAQISPTIASFLGDKFLSGKDAKVALLENTAKEHPDRALILMKEMEVDESDAVWHVARPMAEQGLEHLLHFVRSNLDDHDQNYLERLAQIAAEVRPVEVMRRLNEFRVVEEERLGRVVSTCLHTDFTGSIEHVGKTGIKSKEVFHSIAKEILNNSVQEFVDSAATLGVEADTALLLEAYHRDPHVVMPHLDTFQLPSEVVADLFRESAFKNPKLIFEELTPARVPEEGARRDIAVIAALAAPERTAAEFDTFHLKSHESQSAVVRVLIQQSPRDFAHNVALFDTLANSHTELAFKCLSRSWWQTVPELGHFKLPNTLRDDLTLESIERDPLRTYRNLHALSPTDPEIIRECVLRAAHQSCQEVIGSIHATTVQDTEVHREVARIAARVSPALLASSISKLNLVVPADHDALIEECLKKDWWEAMQHVGAFELSTDKRNSILRRSIRKGALRTASALGGLKATDLDALESVVLQYVESRTAEAAGNPEFFKTLSQDLRQRAALRMAELNARSTAGAIQHIGIESDDARAEVFAICASRNARDTFANVANFDLKPEALELHWKTLVRGREPERVLELLQEMNVAPGSRLHLIAAQAAVGKSASWLVRNFSLYGIGEESDRQDIAIRCARRNASATESHFKNFALKEPENKLSLAIEISGGNPARVVRACRKFKVPYAGHEDKILRTCAAFNIGAASRWASEQGTTDSILDRAEDLKSIFQHSLALERAVNALHVCEHIVKARGEHPTAERVMREFDKQLEGTQVTTSANEKAQKYIDLIRKLRGRGLPPSQNMLTTLRHVGARQQGVVLGLLSQSGASFGESICESLKKIYKRGEEIPRDDQVIIRDVISNGFRGFSPLSFRKLQEAYAKSPGVGKLLLRQWQDVSRVVLTGLSASDELRKDKLFVDYVLAAYRPSGMARSDVKRFLETVPDNSKHLDPYHVRAEGYPMQLIALEDVSLQDGSALDSVKLAELGKALLEVEQTPVNKKDFFEMLLRGAQRASGQVDKTKMLAYISRNVPGGLLSKQIASLGQKLVDGENSEKASYQILSKLQELYTSSIESGLEVLIPPLVGKEGDDREQKFIPSQKVLRNVRRMLNLPAEMEVDEGILSQALILELGKVFRSEEKIVDHELKKFDTGSGTVTGSFRMYLSKSQSAFFGRAGAGLCTARDTWSWNNKSYLQMMMVDESRGRIVGNIQLHLFKNKQGQKSVLARVNPTSSFVSKVNKDRLASEMLRVVRDFAEGNDLIPYLPEQGGWHSLTNRGSFAPSLRKFYGQSENTSVRITRGHSVGKIYRMKSAF